MALARKKSRPIAVDGMDYRYSISTTEIDDSRTFRLNLTIQLANGKGSALKIDGIVTRDVWLDFSRLSKFKKEDYPVFRIGDISRVIKTGHRDGWDPRGTGKPYVLKLDNSFMKNFAIS